ncbi:MULTISPECIES: MerR family transcriptional regulator [unclassified Meiothermus]|uniref:MerR family transcriptional regulator n=1 Tax=unclassified Meiothermus TaxID=370471 RepID=UPI000D7C3618|nr:MULTISPECIES: MerR family transcriptional regulator [unclassified Meiothermus]PZA06170.1 MerR family transcriptional regulator [Meiothermus sp. Pnk-1]RYM36188.1 MerR family transcriptional regulator [Meiothermus sp. PNK-Is4]
MSEPRSKPSTPYLSIGEFSRRSRLSLKALRLYDALGLLPPAYVDAPSGYRYYREDQLERARLIGLLRQLAMPLERIAAVLELEGVEARRAVRQYWEEVEADLKTKRALVRYLEGYLGGEGGSMPQIQTREVPPQNVATIQRKVNIKDLSRFIEEAFSELYGHITASGLEVRGAPLVIYHGQVNEDSDGPVEICVPFAGRLEPTGRIRVRLEPAHHEAFTRINKAQVNFPAILEAYDAVARWLKDQGKPMSGPAREVYFARWDALGPDDPACDVAFPYA